MNLKKLSLNHLISLIFCALIFIFSFFPVLSSVRDSSSAIALMVGSGYLAEQFTLGMKFIMLVAVYVPVLIMAAALLFFTDKAKGRFLYIGISGAALLLQLLYLSCVNALSDISSGYSAGIGAFLIILAWVLVCTLHVLAAFNIDIGERIRAAATSSKSTILCPNCRMTNPSGTRYCAGCGTPLPQVAAAPAPGQPVYPVQAPPAAASSYPPPAPPPAQPAAAPPYAPTVQSYSQPYQTGTAPTAPAAVAQTGVAQTGVFQTGVHCPNCAAPVEPDSLFCEYCGHKLA